MAREGASPKRILLVEDHPDHAELATVVLRGAGYEVVQCARGEDVLGMANRVAPHLVLMDINLPGMDGLAAMRLLRRHPKTAHIPVLALTAYAMSSERRSILAAGCAGVITKPIDFQDFLASVAALLPSALTTAVPAREAHPA